MDITGIKLLPHNIFLYSCFVLLLCTFISFLTISVHCLPPVSCPFLFLDFCIHVAEHIKGMKKKYEVMELDKSVKLFLVSVGTQVLTLVPKWYWYYQGWGSKIIETFFLPKHYIVLHFQKQSLFSWLLGIYKVKLSVILNMELFRIK